MNKVLKITLIVIGILALAGGAVYAGWMIASQRQTQASTLPFGRNLGWAPGRMMGRGGGMHGGIADGGYGPGMMSHWAGSAASVPLTMDHY